MKRRAGFWVGLVLMAVAAAVLALSSCGGGFGDDSEDAGPLGPPIFGPDTGRG